MFDSGLVMLLRSCGGYEPYLRLSQGVVEPDRVLDFLLRDRLFPRSAYASLTLAEECLERVSSGGLLAAERPVVVLYSGGRDSTCLLDLAVRIAGTARVSALHVNYGYAPANKLDRQLAEARNVLTMERTATA